MSITPAFSPGPWITQAALVGSVRRWTLEDLYEQCSFHIAEKMPSSVIDRRAADQLQDALVLVGLEAVLGDELRGDLGFVGNHDPLVHGVQCISHPVTVITGECPSSKRLSGAIQKKSRAAMFLT